VNHFVIKRLCWPLLALVLWAAPVHAERRIPNFFKNLKARLQPRRQAPAIQPLRPSKVQQSGIKAQARATGEARAGSTKRSWGWLKRGVRLGVPTSVGLSRLLRSETGLWATSSATLGAAESTYLASTTTPLLSGIQRLGFVGGVGLTYSAVRDIRSAKTWNERLDAGGDLAWGVEGMLEFSPVLGEKLGAFAPIVGTIGGVCQLGSGLKRIWTGARERDWCKVKLGALDAASGGLWLAWDLFGIENPLVVGGFIGLMVGREAYANRKEIAAFGKKVGKKMAKGFCNARSCMTRLGQRTKERFKGLRNNMLRKMGRDLDGRDRVRGPPFASGSSLQPGR
jgi:hypothetical protein